MLTILAYDQIVNSLADVLADALSPDAAWSDLRRDVEGSIRNKKMQAMRVELANLQRKHRLDDVLAVLFFDNVDLWKVIEAGYAWTSRGSPATEAETKWYLRSRGWKLLGVGVTWERDGQRLSLLDALIYQCGEDMSAGSDSLRQYLKTLACPLPDLAGLSFEQLTDDVAEARKTDVGPTDDRLTADAWAAAASLAVFHRDLIPTYLLAHGWLGDQTWSPTAGGGNFTLDTAFAQQFGRDVPQELTRKVRQRLDRAATDAINAGGALAAAR